MSYEIIISAKADSQLHKLPLADSDRILNTIERCRIRPHSHAKKLVGSWYYALRSGKFRIIIDIIKNKLVVHVIDVGYRKNIYKK